MPDWPVERVTVRVCRRDGCESIVGHVRYDSIGRWCLDGHAQREGVEDGRQWWHPPRMRGAR